MWAEGSTSVFLISTRIPETDGGGTCWNSIERDVLLNGSTCASDVLRQQLQSFLNRNAEVISEHCILRGPFLSPDRDEEIAEVLFQVSSRACHFTNRCLEALVLMKWFHSWPSYIYLLCLLISSAFWSEQPCRGQLGHSVPGTMRQIVSRFILQR